MAIHQVNSICPVCSKVSFFGKCDMTGHKDKYICPMCGGRHYGEPETDNALGYTCAKCKETSDWITWKKIPLKTGEPVLGPIESCASCNEKLKEDGVVACIETNGVDSGEKGRTGRIVFIKPDEEFLKSIDGAKAIYIEKAVLEKLVKELK